MKIHREGLKIIKFSLWVFALVNLMLIPVFHGQGPGFWTVLIISLFFFLFILFFFRIPKINFKLDEKTVIAPADGTIVAIEHVEENIYFKEKKIQVSIFMSPLNIHVNFFPISGTIKFVRHENGNYWVAWHPKSSSENERTSIVIRPDNGKDIMVRQIAGAVARRIVTYPKPNQTVNQGNELGFIKFGSRIDLFLPLDFLLAVKLNQKVKAGISSIGTFS